MSPIPEVSDQDFIALVERDGLRPTARALGMAWRSAFQRRANIERKIGRQIRVPDNRTRHVNPHPVGLQIDMDDGVVLVGSDAHFWPGEPTTAWRAFVRFAKTLRPKVVVMNGDVIDGARVSRHPPINWEKTPTITEEITVAQERMRELELAVTRACHLVWPLGNHDSRFETRLATVAPDYAKVSGVHLKDHFGERWRPCWSTVINQDIVVKHRYKGGIHALHNNLLWSGKHIFTGHLHSLNVRAHSDYNGTRFAGDTGTLAEPYGVQFTYCEDNPVNWRSGFLVLTIRDRRLQWPEVVHVVEPGIVGFRGELIEV